MPSTINLMYFSLEDIFYFVDVDRIEPAYREDFNSFIEDVIDGVNIPSAGRNFGLTLDSAGAVQKVEIGNNGDPIGYFTSETGDGAFPFQQGFRLENIPPEQVLTDFDSTTLYEFEFEVQNDVFRFSALGSMLVTYRDVIDLIETNTPVNMTYFSTTQTRTPRIQFSSHISGQRPQPNGNGGTVGTTRISFISLNRWANLDVDGSATSTTVPESFATITYNLPNPTADQILTNVVSNDETIFSFSVGTNKNLSVQGNQARTYQDLINTLEKFDEVNAFFTSTGPNKNTLYIYIPVPKSPQLSQVITDVNETGPNVIRDNAKLRGELDNYAGNSKIIQIESFIGLTQNSSIVHVMRNSIAGGFNMLSVLQNSKRSNGSYWTEIIPILNDRRSNNEIVSEIPEQKVVVDAIEDDDSLSEEEKRIISMDANKLIATGGDVLGGEAVKKSSYMQTVGNRLNEANESYINPTATATSTEIDDIQNGTIDNGIADGAIDANGNVLDESLLTPGQRARFIPSPRITV